MLTRPAVLISAPASGQGKTLVTAALCRAWVRQGLGVQVFKCGPDFLDPMVLQVASGRPVYNLDFTLCGEADARRLLYQAAQNCDLIVVEGVMGLYDGTPSSADIAERFGLPVLLTIDASGMAQTFAAVALGLLAYRPALKVAGVIANKVGSAGHAQMLRDALAERLPWFGALQHNPQLQLPERHLGLHRASEIDGLNEKIEAAAQLLMSELPLPPPVEFHPGPVVSIAPLLVGKTIAIARDEAFCFIYPANLETLTALGAELVFFSPLNDPHLPPADAYWLPGGYPELNLPEIAANQSLKQDLHAALQANKPILAECGGMMALSHSIDDQPAFGLLPGHCAMQSRLQGLGSVTVDFPGGTLGAHTFHYGSYDNDLAVLASAKTLFGKPEPVYRYGSVHASFLHFYFASNPVVAAGLFDNQRLD